MNQILEGKGEPDGPMGPPSPEFLPHLDKLRIIAYNAYNAIIDCIKTAMASITIRNLDEKTKSQLRIRAAHNNRSMEEEARNILRASLARKAPTPRNLAEAIRRRFEPLGGVELQLPPREPMREPPEPA